MEFRRVLFRSLRRRPSFWCVIRRLVVEPVGACRHDDLVALLFAEAIFAQHAALVLGALAARRTAAVVGALLGDQLVGREVGEVVERLDPRLAEHDEHRFGQVRNIGQIVLHAKFAAFGARRSEEPTSELPSLIGISYDVYGMKNQNKTNSSTNKII